VRERESGRARERESESKGKRERERERERERGLKRDAETARHTNVSKINTQKGLDYMPDHSIYTYIYIYIYIYVCVYENETNCFQRIVRG